MAREQTPPPVQTIGSDVEGPDLPGREDAGILGLLLVFVTLLLALVAFGSGPVEVDPAGRGNRLDSSLLHDLGGPVDTVEQFMTALSYGQTEVVAGAIAPDADTIALPFLSGPASQIRDTVAIFQDIDAVIQMFGCAADTPGPDEVAARVMCSIVYNSDFIRDLASRPVRGTMDFLVVDGLIARVQVFLEEPPGGGTRAGFDRWLVDFYVGSLDTLLG